MTSEEHIRRKVLLYWISMEDRLYLFRCCFPLALAVTTASASGLTSGIGWLFAAIAIDTGTLFWRRSIRRRIVDVDTEKCWRDAGIFHVAAVATYTIAGFNWVLGEPDQFVVTAIVLGASLMTHCSWVPTMRTLPNILALALPFGLILFAAEAAGLLNTTSLLLSIMLLGTTAVIMHFNRHKYFETFAQLQAEQELTARLDQAYEAALIEKERAEEANRSKSAFLATMSHEIRTPMNAIMGFSDLVMRMSDDPKIREYGQYINDASLSLLTVLNDVLDFSKIEADRIEIERRPVELAALFESLLFWVGRARERKIDFHIEASGLPEGTVFADEGRLRQILSNMVSNALKFTPEGGKVWLRGSVVSAEGDNVRVRFEVEDTGIGFSDDVASQLFMPFVQANGDIAKTYGGTGLGLAISAKLVGLMGGQIGARGKSGQGALFWFEVPFVRASMPLSRTA
ncbi:MAG: ATP-binding protein [Parvibaculum sp.]|uniref:sensor histidine kinase n=1 Tax=Parvibaculum sp. TaxID=2024848 RepID=UPI003C726FE5